MASGTEDDQAGGFGQGPCKAFQGTGTEVSSGGLKMVTNASSRFLRPWLIAAAALAAVVAFAPWSAEAQKGGGGKGGGGGHSGGSGHAGGGAPRGGGSQGGGGAYHGGGGYRGGGAYHGRGWYGGGYRGYRGAGWGYHPYGWGSGWGWAPYYSSWWWGGPNGYIGTGGYGYGDGDEVAVGNVGVSTRTGRYAVVKTDVSPEEAQIFLDGKFIGSADDFDGMPDFLYLGTGKYHIEFRLPGYQSLATDLEVSRGQRVRLDQKLKLEPGKSALDQFPPGAKGTPLGRVFTKGADVEEVMPAPAPRYLSST